MESFIHLIEYVHDDYPNRVFYVRNYHDLLFEWDKNDGTFGCNNKIFETLSLCQLSTDESKLLIKKFIKSYLRVKNVKINEIKVVSNFNLLSRMKPKTGIIKYKNWNDFK